MKEANEEFAASLNEVDVNDAEIPVYANVTAEPVKDRDEIKDLLIKQLYSPVRFEESIQNMLYSGVDAFVEVGTGRVLRDRKSTRLNSSHVAISYAVFCLKKKK